MIIVTSVIVFFFAFLCVSADDINNLQVQCPAGRYELVKDLNVTLEKNSTACGPNHLNFKCLREGCEAIEEAVCVFAETDENTFNWTCTPQIPSDIKFNDYLLNCPTFNLSGTSCINKDCCVLYYELAGDEEAWYKSWTAIAIITAIVILSVLLAMLILHCKTVLKSFHKKRRQASESCARVSFTK